MSDMLVKLYELPDVKSLELHLKETNIEVRNAIAPEKTVVSNWVNTHFSQNWKDEVEVCFANSPVSCIVAIHDKAIVGFACYEATAKGFFGPTGVIPAFRKKGIGKILLLKALEGLKNIGYAYGIIGGVGPTDFYEKTVGATLIPNSTPGIYKNLLKK